MTNELTNDANMNNSSVPSVFSNEEFGSVRVVMINNEPYFVLSDVAKALGYAQPVKSVNDICNAPGMIYTRNIQTNAGERQVKVGPESEVYRLIFGSKLPSAKKFQDWVFQEVLPQIRKTGSYSAQKQLPQTYAEALRELASTVEEKERLALENKAQTKEIKSLNNQIAIDAPKVEFAKQVNAVSDSVTFDEFAKIISKRGFVTGRNKLFATLRTFGLIQKNTTLPNQIYITKGIFEVKEIPNGPFLNRQTLITGKGQLYIFDLLKPMMHRGDADIFE